MDLKQCRKCLAWRPKFQKRCQCEKWAFSVQAAVREMHLLERTDARIHVSQMPGADTPITFNSACFGANMTKCSECVNAFCRKVLAYDASKKLEQVKSHLLAYEVHTLRGAHDRAARNIVDALALLDLPARLIGCYQGTKREEKDSPTDRDKRLSRPCHLCSHILTTPLVCGACSDGTHSHWERIKAQPDTLRPYLQQALEHVQEELKEILRRGACG